MKRFITTSLQYVNALAGTVLLAAFFTASLYAGEIASLAWDGPDTLKMRISGGAGYKVETLEDGQRLRLIFPDSSIGPALNELAGQGIVKGVYPYLADNGTTVNVDLLLTEPGRLEVSKIDDGYRVTARAASAIAAAPSAVEPKAAEPPATPPVAAVPPAPESAPTPP